MLFIPIVIYINTFGFGVWDNHTDWGIMGSAFGGIYSIFFSFCTIMVLILQFILQRNMDEHHDGESVCGECVGFFRLH
ncbi:hypothetical protein [Vibrio caribbeanicus]|uniref:hypothetical protein n=1 Tax=Vibrio caribbeanicus TaxID=701175 RepID=UPI0030D86AC2